MAAGEGAAYPGVVIEAPYSPRSQTVESAIPVFESSPVPAVALVCEMPETRLDELVARLRPFGIQFLSPDGAEQSKRLKKIAPGLQIWQSLFLPASGESEAEFDPGEMIGQIEKCKEAGVDAVVLDTAAVLKGVMRMGGSRRPRPGG
jgi:phosphoribosylanthranilate isomerase